MEDDIEERFQTAGRFAEALKQGEFELFCQPIVSVPSAVVDHKYLEIFVRFREEEDKLIPPGTFFPILEANHLTSMLDQWVVREVLRWIARKLRAQANWRVPRFSINLADDTIRDQDFGAFLRTELTTSRIAADRISFEITAVQTKTHFDAVKQLTSNLKILGCPVAISDFAGNAAVAKRYKDMGFQLAKFEGSFIRNAHKSDYALGKLLELCDGCRKAGLQTIAEFVEQAETIKVLEKVGVEFAQGFFIGVPEPLRLVT